MEIVCGFTACPTLTVSWERNGQSLMPGGRISMTSDSFPEGHVTTKLSTLKINRVTQEDNGEYKCIGQNQYGSAEGTAPLSIPGTTAGECYYTYMNRLGSQELWKPTSRFQ